MGQSPVLASHTGFSVILRQLRHHIFSKQHGHEAVCT